LNFNQFREAGLRNLKKAKTEPGFSVSHPGERVIRTANLGFNFHSIHGPEYRAYDKVADKTPKNKSIQNVPLSDLHTSQYSVNAAHVAHHLNSGETDQIPQVTKYRGRTWVDDGHHRIAAFMLGGATHMPMTVSEQ